VRIPSCFLGLTNNVPDTLGGDREAIGQTELKNASGTFVVLLDGHRQLRLVKVIRDMDFFDHETEELPIYIDGAAFLLRDTHRFSLHRLIGVSPDRNQMSENLHQRVEILEKQVSDLSFLLGVICFGTYCGFLDPLSRPVGHMEKIKDHVRRGGFVGLEVTKVASDTISFGATFRVNILGETLGPPTVWERVAVE